MCMIPGHLSQAQLQIKLLLEINKVLSISAMKNRETTSSLHSLFLFLVLLLLSYSIPMAYSRKTNHCKKKGNSQLVPPPPLPTNGIFDILSFGAKGDGISDDSKALLAAWKAACSSSNVLLSGINIPSNFKFLIKPVTLQGPCTPHHLILQIDGSLVAPRRGGSWTKSSLFQWINFKWLQNFTIQGSGILDGQGFDWWSSDEINSELQQKKSKSTSSIKPTALRFYSSENVAVRDIVIKNSPLCHLKFDNSKGVNVENITISSPEDSLNTDGIHLQNTQDVVIQHSTIASGDDCVSIQTGCTNVFVHHMHCGPGHGISLGGLGKDKTVACVADIVVDNIVMYNTEYGARIKTWQGGMGAVKNVSFSNIQMHNVKVPIMIDQFYCDKGVCRNQSEAVAISGVKFDQINGTYSSQAIHLACSASIPCTGVDLISIRLFRSSSSPSSAAVGFDNKEGFCFNSYGNTEGLLFPSSMDYCLRKGINGIPQRVAKSIEKICRVH